MGNDAGLPRLAVVDRYAWAVRAREIVVADLDRGTSRTLPLAAAETVVAAGRDAWVRAPGAVHRFAADGAPIAVIDIDRSAPTGALTPCRIGEGAVVVQGPRPVRIDGRAVTVLGAATECVVPLIDGVILRVGRGFAVRRGRECVMLAIPADLAANARLCGGAVLQGGKLVGLELRSRGGHYLIVVDLGSNHVISRLRLTDARSIVWIEERAQVVVVRTSELLALDLEHGRCINARRLETSDVEVAGDELGVCLVLDAGDHLTTLDYSELVGTAPPARASVPPAPPQAPIESPVTETPPPVDARQPRIAEPAPAPAVTALPDVLPGLGLRPVPPPIDPAHLARVLADTFALVAALCRRAIADAWDSGRLETTGVLPFADEVAATLDGADGRTPEALALAQGRERAAEVQFARQDLPDLPLGDLAAEHGLSDLAARIALIVAAPRMWPELARIYAIISNDRGRPLIDELLVAQLIGVGRTDRRRIALELADDAPLIRRGIVLRGPGERAFASLSVPSVIALRLAGDRFGLGLGARAATIPLGGILAPRGKLAAFCGELGAARTEPVRIILRGRGGSGRRTLVAALAGTAGRAAGLVEASQGPGADEQLRADLRDSTLRGHLPCVSGLDALGDDPSIRARLQRVLDDHPGPLVVRCEPGAHPPLAPGACVLDLDPLEEADRAQAWRGALAAHGLAGDPADALARRWAVGPGTALRAAALVAREPGASSTTTALDGAVRRLRADRLAGLADKVERLADWSALILPEDMVDSLRELIARVRHRNVVLRTWGMERVSSTAHALTALFQGGPGTGKTLAASVLARELGYDLYRVDISRVMSRWLGETEKNLARIFDGASDGETILLFDEADTLFGRRTEVKSSHDRYANVETNYLLQRLDSWNGIAILTTNFGTAIDPAFRRRLTLQLQFPFPDDGERAQLWRAHLPESIPTSGDLDLAAIAGRFKLSGGYIRNAALRACYLAVGEESALTADHLVRAIKLEYRDMAKVAEGGRLE